MFLSAANVTTIKHIDLTGFLQSPTENKSTSELKFLSNKYDSLLTLYSQDNDFTVEIKEAENEHILEILGVAVYNLIDYLNNHNDKAYELKLYLSQDIEIPDWKQFTIHIDSQINDYDQREALWDNLIEILSSSYQEYLQRVNIINETAQEKDAYRRISLIVD